MNQQNTKPLPASGCLSQIGLVTVVACVSLLVVTLTVLLPPWVKVKSQRTVDLYWTRQVKVYEQTFVGYDFLFAFPKWEKKGWPAQLRAGDTFDVTEYRVFWPLLSGEWVVVGLAAGCLFVLLSRRLGRADRLSGRQPVVNPKTADKKIEQNE